MTTTLARLDAPSQPLRSPAEDELPGFGGIACELGQLPLRAMDVTARIVGLDVVVELRQRFANPTGRLAEVSYVFPLPARAALTSFSALLGGRRVVGTLRERQVARQLYDDAIASGHRAGIVEEERPEVFTARLGNLGPGEDAAVECVLVQRLAVADGEATFRFPLVVAPRYVPGSPLEGVPVGEGVALDSDAVPDASRVSPPVLLDGCPNPVALSLSVEVDPAGLALSDLRCSLHALAEGAPAPGSAIEAPLRIELVPGERLDRDFLLRLRLAGDALEATAVLVADADGRKASGGEGAGTRVAGDGAGAPAPLEGDGTFLVTIVPSRTANGLAGAALAQPLDVCVVLDRSGSMSGWKMVAARRAAGRIVDALGGTDRFALLAFDDVVESFEAAVTRAALTRPAVPALPPWHEATDPTRYRAVEWLARLEARGGTELAGAIGEALAGIAAIAGTGGDGRQRVVVLVTDGQVADEDRLVELASNAAGKVRVHCVGIDQAVNGGLLERLARVGGGSCELVESEQRLDEVLVALHRRIRSPQLLDVRLTGEGLELLAGSLSPAGALDAFSGVPLELTGRYRGSGSLVLHATHPDGSDFEQLLQPVRSSETSLRAIWGRARIRDLEDAYAARGGEAIAAAVVATSLATGVLSRHTAFLAVDEAERWSDRSGAPASLLQPVALPSGWQQMQAQGVFAAPPGGPIAAAPRALPYTGAPAPGAPRRFGRLASPVPVPVPPPATPAAAASGAAARAALLPSGTGPIDAAAIDIPEAPSDAELARIAAEIASAARSRRLHASARQHLASGLEHALLSRRRARARGAAGSETESETALETAWLALVAALRSSDTAGIASAADTLHAAAGALHTAAGGLAARSRRDGPFWRRPRRVAGS